MNTDDKIRAILRMEADAVEPSAAGWDAIQAGVAARRARAWWTRGFALAGALAVVAGGVAYVAADPAPRGIEQTPTTQGPPASGSVSPAPSATPSPSPTATATATPALAVADEPIGAIWPLTTTREVAAWQADRTTYPSLATATGAATAFARTYLGIADPAVVPLGGEYGENDFDVRRDGLRVSTLTVRGYGDGGTAPFVVTAAAAPDLRIGSPAPGDVLSGAVTVTGGYEAVDPALDVVLRADTGATAPVELATARATTGPDGWRARLSFTTTAKTGSLLVTNASPRDGGLGSAAAVPVTFGGAAAAGPTTMVAAREGRIAVISTATGEVVRWLTGAQPGGGAYDPELADGYVRYAQAAGTCSSEIRAVRVTGGQPERLTGGDEGALRSPSRRSDVLAYVRTRCADGGSAEEVVMTDGHTERAEAVAGTVRSHVVTTDRFVAYVTERGGRTTLHSVDFFGELADMPTAAPSGCVWEAVTAGARDANGRRRLVAAATCGTGAAARTRLYRMDADLRGRTLVATLDVRGVRSLDYSGPHLLVGTDDGTGGHAAYVWSGGVLRRIPGEAQRPSWS